jgi:hypothetical protein
VIKAALRVPLLLFRAELVSFPLRSINSRLPGVPGHHERNVRLALLSGFIDLPEPAGSLPTASPFVDAICRAVLLTQLDGCHRLLLFFAFESRLFLLVQLP